MEDDIYIEGIKAFGAIVLLAGFIGFSAYEESKRRPAEPRVSQVADVQSIGKSSAYEDKLRQAVSLEIEREGVFNHNYNIQVNGENIANVVDESKDYIDFVLRTNDGKLIASEERVKKMPGFSNAAQFYSASGETSGYLGLNRAFSAEFNFFDADKNLLAKGKDGVGDYTLNKHTFGGWTIKTSNKDSKVPLENVILGVCLEDYIQQQESD